MPNQATTVAALVEAVQQAVAYTFGSGTYGIQVRQVDLSLQLVLARAGGGDLEWRVLTVSGELGEQQTQTLQLSWTHTEVGAAFQARATLTDSLISGLNAADLGVHAWNTQGLPLAFRSGQLTFELAVSEGGQLSVAVLKVGTSQKTTHTVTLSFGPAPARPG